MDLEPWSGGNLPERQNEDLRRRGGVVAWRRGSTWLHLKEFQEWMAKDLGRVWKLFTAVIPERQFPQVAYRETILL